MAHWWGSFSFFMRATRSCEGVYVSVCERLHGLLGRECAYSHIEIVVFNEEYGAA